MKQYFSRLSTRSFKKFRIERSVDKQKLNSASRGLSLQESTWLIGVQTFVRQRNGQFRIRFGHICIYVSSYSSGLRVGKTPKFDFSLAPYISHTDPASISERQRLLRINVICYGTVNPFSSILSITKYYKQLLTSSNQSTLLDSF